MVLTVPLNCCASCSGLIRFVFMNVSIIGTGYVGLTTGTCLAFLGHKVTCIDSDEKKIALLQAGQTPIYEPFLTELMAEAHANLRFTTGYAAGIPGRRAFLSALGTPT